MPDWQPAIRTRLRGVPLDPAREAEIVEELSAHLDDRYREQLRAAVAGPVAERAAIAELEALRIAPRPRHDPLPIGSKEGRNLMANIWHDVKVALRMMRSKPAFSAAVVFM